MSDEESVCSIGKVSSMESLSGSNLSLNTVGSTNEMWSEDDAASTVSYADSLFEYNVSLDATVHANQQLATENWMMERFLSKVSSGEFIMPKKRLTGHKYALSKSTKLEIAKKMMRELEISQEDQNRKAEKTKENFQRLRNVYDEQLADIEKEKIVFENEFNVENITSSRNRLSGEKVARYFNNSLKNKDSTIKMSIFKIESLKIQYRKKKELLKKRREITGPDIEQQKILNEQHKKSMSELKRQLQKTRHEIGLVNQQLDSIKKKISALRTEKEKFAQRRKLELEAFEKRKLQLETVKKEIETDAKVLQQMREKKNCVIVPDVKGYISLENQIKKLECDVALTGQKFSKLQVVRRKDVATETES